MFYIIFNKLEVKYIDRISSFITKMIYRDKIIKEDEVESCTYGLQITIANLINFAIAFSVGVLTKSLVEMALFYGIFVSLRFFCGGYHAKSYGRCFSLFTITCSVYPIMLNGILTYVGNTFLLLTAAISLLGMCIWVKAPIEHTNRPFTTEERKLFRKRSIQLFLMWSIVGIILWIEQLERLSVGFICVFWIISIYMLVGRREKDEEENA